MRYVKIIAIFVRLGVLNELEYRANFLVQLVQVLVSLMVSLGGLAVIFDHTTALNGWTQAELLAVVGVYFMIGGLVNMSVQPSLGRFMQDIREGTLDFKLIKPVDAQLIVSVSQVQIWKLIDVVLGMVILLVAVFSLGLQVGAVQAVNFLIAMLCGGAIVYSSYLILATMAFWFVKVDNILVVFESMYEAGRYPVGIYPMWLRFALTFLVPIAFAVTIPAEAFTGRLTSGTLLLGVVMAFVLLTASRLFWLYGIRNYTGASA